MSSAAAHAPLPEPSAPRLRRPSWRDPRLTVGVVIVALSVALGSWAVSSAGHTVPVYVASGALTAGEPVQADALRTVDVRLSTNLDRYLRADRPLPDGLVAVRTVLDGELVPRSALGDAAGSDLRSVAVPVGSGLSDRIRPGAVVDLWFVPAAPVAEGVARPEPRLLAGQVVVEQVDAPEGALVVAGSSTLHALVPADVLPAVLTALADAGTAGSGGGTLAVVPAAGTGA
nr:hypothetical protein [Antribacter gilvus]